MTKISKSKLYKVFKEEMEAEKRTKTVEKTISYAAAINIDFSAKDYHAIGEVTGNLTINGTNIANGQTGYIRFTIDVTGGYAIALGTGPWLAFDGSIDIASAKVASTEYIMFYVINDTTIKYNINSISP